jgi:hypothetical protein
MSNPRPLDYAVRQARVKPRISGGAIAAIGMFLSWGPGGILLAWLAGQVLGSLDVSADHPYPDSRISSFIIGLLLWPMIGLLGTYMSLAIGSRVKSRQVEAWIDAENRQ